MPPRTRGLDRHAPLKPTTSLAVARPKPTPISPASKQQRLKVRGLVCVVCGRDRHEAVIDPGHVVSRALGGCNSADCVIPLCREHHSAYDTGTLDLSLYLTGTHVAELTHALEHMNGSLTRLLRHLSGKVWQPVEEGQAYLAALAWEEDR